MPAAVGTPLFGLPPAGRGQRGGLHDHGADRSAVPGQAVLWLAADGGMAGDPGPSRQSQTRPAPDAARRIGGDLPATNTSKPAVAHKIYPYLLGGISIERVNQVWCSDVTYIPMAKGFLYLVVIMDWVSRAVL